MKSNLASFDRGIRIAAGLLLPGMAALGMVGWWGWLGLVLLFTGFLGWCPIYALLGFSSRGAQPPSSD